MRQHNEKSISLNRAIRKTPFCVVFGKEANKECHNAETNKQLPREDSAVEDEATETYQLELENGS